MRQDSRCVQGWAVEVPNIVYPVGQWLAGKENTIHSQFGEDGLIAACIERIGADNRWCLEVGAGDGVHLSNTKVLRDAGWNAVLIEAEDSLFERLVSQSSERVRCVHKRIAPDSLDRILAEHGVPVDMDFASIDIDGQDYWIWKGLEVYKPRLVCIEFNPYGTPDEPPPPLGVTEKGQAGLNPMLALAESKGYTPLGTTYCNLFAVRNDVLNG